MQQINWQVKEDWWHFTDIGGIVTGQLAVAVAQRGNLLVTGSGEGIFEPMKSFLEKQKNIPVKTGFNYANLTLKAYTGKPEDAYILPARVIAAGAISEGNKELQFARKRGIPVLNFAQLFETELVVDGKSIVVAGSFGKTTTTALLIKIFEETGKEISYMVGALVAGIDNGVRLKTESTEYSIVEGDEYISSRSDYQSKFFHYKPNFLVLTGYAYDHTDVFLTPEDYYQNFDKLIKQVPESGLIVYNARYPQLKSLAELASCKVVGYEFTSDSEVANWPAKLLGDFNRENILAAATLARSLGVNDNFIKKAVAQFLGVKRRLETVFENERLRVIDDFGASPAKAKASLEVVRKQYPAANIIGIFEPNIGNRTYESFPEYSEVFKDANVLILPKFHAVKQQNVISETDLHAELLKTHSNTKTFIANGGNDNLAETIISNLAHQKQNIVIFLSSNEVSEKISTLIAKLPE